ncbi:MAG: hypothetical protein JSW73_03510 [Candidatus Woesearchaeota archaeon]|nr:MAG: hypothetical protein JSW73_03510 [Candidatus Woesearchaeota archaeon]
MNLRIIIPILVIGLIFISGCSQNVGLEPSSGVDKEKNIEVTERMGASSTGDKDTQELSESQIKSIVYNAIKKEFPEIARTSSIEDFKHRDLNKKCGNEWYFDVDENLLAPYPRVQVCEEGEAYTLDELYTAYEEAADDYREEYKDDESMKNVIYRVSREGLTNGDVISFKIINSDTCENGITLRFPCRNKYVIELITTYSCNDVNTENRIKNVANEILSYC